MYIYISEMTLGCVIGAVVLHRVNMVVHQLSIYTCYELDLPITSHTQGICHLLLWPIYKACCVIKY